MIDICKCIFTILGTFIGAGLASGKEIYVFFYKHGMYGIIGILISTLIIGIVSYKTIKIVKKYKINNYDEFNNIVYEKKEKKKLLNKLISIFLEISFCIMISGFCSFFKQEFNINIYISYFIIIILCVYIFLNNLQSLLKMNNLVIPIIIISIIFLFLLYTQKNALVVKKIHEVNNVFNNFFIDSILYANYNLISIIPINILISNLLNNKKINEKNNEKINEKNNEKINEKKKKKKIMKK